MKAKDLLQKPIESQQVLGSEKLIGRREAFNKAGMYALSAATMMILMKSQPAQAQSGVVPTKNVESTSQTGTWKRTGR